MSKAAFPWLAVGRGGVRSRGGEAVALTNTLHAVRKLSGRRPCAHCLLGHPTSYLFSRSCWPSPPQPQTHTLKLKIKIPAHCREHPGGGVHSGAPQAAGLRSAALVSGVASKLGCKEGHVGWIVQRRGMLSPSQCAGARGVWTVSNLAIVPRPGLNPVPL